jgi:chemotaxis protein methyltransferase CheR
MNPADYDYLCQFLKERSGLALAADKEYLVESRLLPVARRNGCVTTSELVNRLRLNSKAELAVQITEAMMNNESFFFRDKIPFDRLRDTILPDVIERRASRKHMRIWCAAASTGQEPYSIAMILDERPELKDWRVEIVATDISGDALEKGMAGVYTQFEVQRGLPIQMLIKYFDKVGDQWRINDAMRKMVQFRRFNLLSDLAPLGLFDIVFCRNVLIYFDQATKLDVIARVRAQTASDGYLILGAAETMVGLGNLFAPSPDRRGFYQPVRTPVLTSIPGGMRVA